MIGNPPATLSRALVPTDTWSIFLILSSPSVHVRINQLIP